MLSRRFFCSAAVAVKNTGRKVIKTKGNRPVLITSRQRDSLLQQKNEKENLPWRIVGATILHRVPVIHPNEESWETEMRKLQDKIDDKKREAFLDLVGGTKAQLTPDKYPSFEEILDSLPFVPASRITEADKTNDRRSLERCLDKSLFLIVKRNRSDHAWQFPQGKVLETETALKTTAERVLDRAVGNTLRWFPGNAPSGHYFYEYPKEVKDARKQFGSKVFFFRSQLLAGNIKLETRLYKDYAWITRSEVNEYFDPITAEYITSLLPE